MSNSWLSRALTTLARIGLACRYKVKLHGIENLPKKKVLFLADHAAEVDPLILCAHLWPRFQPHFVAADFANYVPILRTLVRILGIITIPEFRITMNSFKKKRLQEGFDQCVQALEKGENLFLYPGGQLTRKGKEVIVGASGVQEILARASDVNVVLVKTVGLRGSLFSTEMTGTAPPVVSTYLKGIRIAFKNLLFFTPKRKVEIFFSQAPQDFPRNQDRKTLIRYLEDWYNKEGEEPVSLVSYSRFRSVFPQIPKEEKERCEEIESIPLDIQKKVIAHVAKLVEWPEEKITPELDFSRDLGMDSLDRAQLVLILEEYFQVKNVAAHDISTVKQMMLFAHKNMDSELYESVIAERKKRKVFKKRKKNAPQATGKTVMERFLNVSSIHKKDLALEDSTSGSLSFLKLRKTVLVLSQKFKTYPEKHIGVLLPASSGAFVVILALQMAKKVPVPLNWTLGTRALNYSASKAQLKRTISSWRFLNRLSNVDLGELNNSLELIEDVRAQLTWKEKITGLFYAALPTFLLKRVLGIHKISLQDPAVILFSSGTEADPKGIPLSHENILSNVDGAADSFSMRYTDRVLSFLPPFHSFGFVSTGMLPILHGYPLILTPNPTDSKEIARAIEESGATILASAPTFLQNVVSRATAEQLKSLRCIVLGAEKPAQTLLDLIQEKIPEAFVLEGYGATECSPVVTMNTMKAPAKGVGRPIQGMHVLIVDHETHEPVPIGSPGLVFVHGTSVFQGYLGGKKPFESLQGKLWYNTGDIGRLDKQGYLTLEGRLKRFVKIGGEMISLPSIESALCEEMPVETTGPSFCVLAHENSYKTQLHLMTTLSVSISMINDILKSKGFSNLIRIAHVHAIPQIPLLGSGKINFKSLQAQLEGALIR